ncbi:IS630 family transposase [Runella slithyformis]|uniref:IS630 family transposase n=1 Tax=Runella slithyformis TaxID=106 RepID=UPI000308C3B4|nr:IS630 family transposase [Runella slithyformis]
MELAEARQKGSPAEQAESPAVAGRDGTGIKKAEDENRAIVYIDESGFYLLPLVCRTWAPKGKTPIIEEKAGKEHLSLIAAMAPNGRLYVGGQDKAYNSEGVVDFLEYLCRRYRSKDLIVIWDGATIHRSQAIKDFLARKKGRVHLVALPGYSPELNPVELLWSQLKRELKNRVFLDLTDLAEVLKEKIEEVRKDTELLVSFFKKKEVAFFTG